MPNPVDLESLREMFSDKKMHIVVAQVKKLGLASDRSVLRAQCLILTQEREVIARVCWDACGPSSGSFQFPQVGDMVLLEFAEGSDEQIYLTKRLSNKEDVIPTQAVEGDMVHRALPGKKLYLLSDTKTLIGRGGIHLAPDEPLVLGNLLKEFLSTVLQAQSTQAQELATMADALKTLTDDLKEVTDELNTMATDLATHTHPTAAPGSPSPPTTAAAYVASAIKYATGSSAMTTAGNAMETAKTAMEDAEEVYSNQKSSPVDDGEILSDVACTEKGDGL